MARQECTCNSLIAVGLVVSIGLLFHAIASGYSASLSLGWDERIVLVLTSREFLAALVGIIYCAVLACKCCDDRSTNSGVDQIRYDKWIERAARSRRFQD
jgi:hypothetical protein